MQRAILTLTVALAIFSIAVIADDNKGNKPKADVGINAMYVKADDVHNTMTFNTTDKSGKSTELKLPLDRYCKIIGQDNKYESLEMLAKSMESKKDKSILVIEDKEGKHILEIRELTKKP